MTTAASPGCPLTRSHTRERWRTRCRVHTHSSPTWTCSRGRNRTQVRKTPPAILPGRCLRSGFPAPPQSAPPRFQTPDVGPFPESSLATGCCATRWFCISVRRASNCRALHRPAVTQSVSSGAPGRRRAQVQDSWL